MSHERIMGVLCLTAQLITQEQTRLWREVERRF